MVGTPDELLPDRGAVAAREARGAAATIRVFDGRATAWLVLQRLLEVVGMALLLSGIAFGSLLVGQWVWILVGVGLLLFAYDGPVGRLAGAEPPRWRTRSRVAAVTVVIAGVILVGLATAGSTTPDGDQGFLAGVGGLAAYYLVAPALRWLWSRRRPRPTVAWPDGAQAFAVLSVLSRAQWVHLERLATLTELPVDRCEAWVRACAARGLATAPGARRLLPRHPEITPAGRARLDRWAAELAERAAGDQPCTDSTAPTSAEVSSARSSSEVT